MLETLIQQFITTVSWIETQVKHRDVNSYRAPELMYIHPLRRPLCTACRSFGIVPWQRRPVKPGSHLHLQDEMLRCPCRPQLIRHGFLGISDNKNVKTATTTHANTHPNKPVTKSTALKLNCCALEEKSEERGIKKVHGGAKKRSVILRL